ncbi:MAG: S-layer homology domain-containing protein [Evtepia sp.]|uniref:S-layer homology domain-containing protein n=1 Tax=Evtepia sp. TaxID=2773933 RepID=UPI002A759501|nr:S-layer homology domain-containing protein [Evtepia sp.]MDY3013981.1 S-layer homology domain-containing protein [Evtepia sp.]
MSRILLVEDGGVNYNDYVITVILTGTCRKVPSGAPNLSTTTITYGQSLSAITLSGAMQDGEEAVPGTFTWDAPDTMPAAGRYEAQWTFTPDNSDLYASVQGSAAITVNKATPTGEPRYTSITSGGKTLADAGLTTEGGTFSVKGTVTWELDNTTEVKANTSYKWIFTPEDSHNYNSISGSIELWHKSLPSGSAITVLPTDNGTVTCYAKGAEQGATVTVNVKPQGGYHLDKLVVTDAKGNVIDVKQESYGTYTFVMPASKVTIEGVFVKNSPEVLPFTDVKPTDWFYNSVKYVYDKGLMDGVEGGQFAPNATLNRAMLVTILYRLDGQPAVSGDMPFEDVPAGTWYTNAVKWASDNGIVNGVEGNRFAPSGDLTREQMSAILYRYAQYKKWDVSASADLTAFVDGDKTSPWAADAMKWAVGAGLINGLEGNTLAPQGTSTRAQVSTVLMRFCENIVK